jgi:hypothetical protein
MWSKALNLTHVTLDRSFGWGLNETEPWLAVTDLQIPFDHSTLPTLCIFPNLGRLTILGSGNYSGSDVGLGSFHITLEHLTLSCSPTVVAGFFNAVTLPKLSSLEFTFPSNDRQMTTRAFTNLISRSSCSTELETLVIHGAFMDGIDRVATCLEACPNVLDLHLSTLVEPKTLHLLIQRVGDASLLRHLKNLRVECIDILMLRVANMRPLWTSWSQRTASDCHLHVVLPLSYCEQFTTVEAQRVWGALVSKMSITGGKVYEQYKTVTITM